MGCRGLTANNLELLAVDRWTRWLEDKLNVRREIMYEQEWKMYETERGKTEMRARRCGHKNVTKDIHGFGAPKTNAVEKRGILELIQQMIWIEKVKTSKGAG